MSDCLCIDCYDVTDNTIGYCDDCLDHNCQQD